MDDFSHNLLATILFRVPEQGERVSGGSLTVVAINSRDAGSCSCFKFLFRSRSFCAPPACAVHFVGCFRGLADTLAPDSRWLHIGSLAWGILTELLPWPCPLTLLENWLEGNAGVEPDQGGFLLHYLDKLVYPDIYSTMLTIAAVIVCGLNLAFYGRQVWIAGRAGSSD
jgi:hypothetical protein